ncbi:MAG: hypothetical protein AAFV29_03955, partial [Myxococcota bacterium]
MIDVAGQRHCLYRRTPWRLWAAMLIAGLVACDARVDVRVVTSLDVPTEADLMVVTASASQVRTAQFALDGAPLRFSLAFESSPPARLPMNIDLRSNGRLSGRANVVLADASPDDCFTVFVPSVGASNLAFAARCEDGLDIPDAGEAPIDGGVALDGGERDAGEDLGVRDAGEVDAEAPFDAGIASDGGGIDGGLDAGVSPDIGVDAGMDAGFPGPVISVGYEPSNIRLDGLRWAPSLVVPDGQCILDTDVPEWSGAACTSTPPLVVRAQRNGEGMQVVVVAVESLTIQTTATLRIRGMRPAVLVVERDAQIAGSI